MVRAQAPSAYFASIAFPLTTTTMSYFLPHLPSGWHVDEAIKSEEDRVVVIRFGHDWDSQCMTMDETLYGVAEKVQNFAVIYLCDITKVPDFNKVE